MIELLIYDLQHSTTEEEAHAAYRAILRTIYDEDSRIWYEQMYLQRIQMLKEMSFSECSDKAEKS